MSKSQSLLVPVFWFKYLKPRARAPDTYPLIPARQPSPAPPATSRLSSYFPPPPAAVVPVSGDVDIPKGTQNLLLGGAQALMDKLGPETGILN